MAKQMNNMLMFAEKVEVDCIGHIHNAKMAYLTPNGWEESHYKQYTKIQC